MSAKPFNDQVLDRECSVFSIYLIGQAPSDYVKQKYRMAHRSLAMHLSSPHAAEYLLVRVATAGPWGARIVDGYVSVFRKYSVVRKKFVLLLAILESCAPAHQYLDRPDSVAAPILALRLIGRCLAFLVAFAFGIFLLCPVDLMLRWKAQRVASQLKYDG